VLQTQDSPRSTTNNQLKLTNWIWNLEVCSVHSARILRCLIATKRARHVVLTAFMTTKVGRANIIPAYRAILRELYKSVRIHRHPCLRSFFTFIRSSQSAQGLREVGQLL
jgi:hypothetical protein